jgi:dipeptidyl aminopeptidase/acylaminoacyl peptidase
MKGPLGVRTFGRRIASRNVPVYNESRPPALARLAYDRAVGRWPALEEDMRRLVLALILAPALAAPAAAQDAPPVRQYLAPAYPYELVSAARADRVAWLAYEEGRRNVYTAVAPGFRPVRLTRFLEDDGIDLTTLSMSADGSVVVFVRGHERNRSGWVANVTSDPAGAERAVWAVRTAGGRAWRLAEGTAPVVSPDGRYAAFAKDGQIHCVRVTAAHAALSPVDRGDVPLIKVWGTNGSPRWSPDSSKVAFVSDRGDHSFIGVYDLKSRTVTYMAPGVDRDSSPTWSSDSRRIAFLRRPGTPFGMQAQPGSAGIGNPPGPAAAAGAVGRGQQAGGQRGSMAGAAQGGQPERGALAGSPGLYRATFQGGYTLAFWVADTASGVAREFWHNQPDDRSFPNITAIEWAGDHVVFQAEPEEWVRYYSVSVAGGTTTPVTLTPGDGMVENVALSKDGRTLYYCTNAGDIDRRHVWKVPTAGGEAAQVTKGGEIETYPAALASGSRIALLSAGWQRPQSVGLAPAAGGAVEIVFPPLPEDFPLARHVAPQNVTLKAEDGLAFNNQLFLPRTLKAGEKRPALIFVHGGPVRQMLLGYHYRWVYHVFYGVNQWLADNGYVVLSVNFRSGIGYGKSFRMAPGTGQRGNAEYQDVVAAARYLQGRPDVDPTRVGIWGLSYGGLLTAQALARNSDIFAAGVDLAGVHLFGSSLDPGSISYTSSAISQIDKWTSPVLLVHGDDDRNVAFSQTVGLVQLLRARDVPHELIVFPDDVHDSLLHRRWLYTFERMGQFFARHLGGAK